MYVRITERDRALLEYAAEHRLVLVTHVRALTGTSAAAAYRRLAALGRAGLLHRRTVFDREPGCYQVSRAGLAVIGSELPPPRLDLRCYRHDVGLAWLWLTARQGAFGELTGLVSERRMRSQDAARPAQGALTEPPHGVRLGGLGPAGAPRLHYPDLMLSDRSGHRIAVELELTSKSRVRRERILAAYGADSRVDAVLYLCTDDAVARAIRSSAARLGLGSLVHVQRARWETAEVAGIGPTAAARRPRRSSGRAEAAR